MKQTIYILAAILAATFTSNAVVAENHQAFISKDKIWHYNVIHYEGGVVVSEKSGPSLRFQEEDIIRNGNNYSVLVETDAAEEKTDTVALFRQEGGKLFFLNNAHLNEFILTEKGFGDHEFLDKEFLAFDFDAKAGDKYLGFVCGDGGFGAIGICVKSADTVEINGVECRRQILCREKDDHGWEIVAIEGIGVSGPIWFFAPYLGDRLDEGRISPHSEWVLHEVTDLDGNVLFTKEDFNGNAGIWGMDSGNPSAADSRKYDFNGREIRNPEPGTVYIQGGRKHVAPRR